MASKDLIFDEKISQIFFQFETDEEIKRLFEFLKAVFNRYKTNPSEVLGNLKKTFELFIH